jgi:hypothetical protein
VRSHLKLGHAVRILGIIALRRLAIQWDEAFTVASRAFPGLSRLPEVLRQEGLDQDRDILRRVFLDD